MPVVRFEDLAGKFADGRSLAELIRETDNDPCLQGVVAPSLRKVIETSLRVVLSAKLREERLDVRLFHWYCLVTRTAVSCSSSSPVYLD